MGARKLMAIRTTAAASKYCFAFRVILPVFERANIALILLFSRKPCGRKEFVDMKTLFIFTAGILIGGAVIAAVAFSNGPISFKCQALVPLCDPGGTWEVVCAWGSVNNHVGGAAPVRRF